MNPYQVTRDFEDGLAEYTHAPFAVAVNSCTAALKLAVEWQKWGQEVEIPARTYCSVPMSVINAGCQVRFRDYPWVGAYRLFPLPVWDCARRFNEGLYEKRGQFLSVSFSTSNLFFLLQAVNTH